jgi:uracil-DNA glycosylase
MLVGQAPGSREPELGRPFAWTAGKTLFRWINSVTGLDEDAVRAGVYFAAMCRCFPGKARGGGDRVPDRAELANCDQWIETEILLLKPSLILPVGRLAIGRFLPQAPLKDIIGRTHTFRHAIGEIDVIPLPHPSGASPWHRMEPGRTLLANALGLVSEHPAMIQVVESVRVN